MKPPLKFVKKKKTINKKMVIKLGPNHKDKWSGGKIFLESKQIQTKFEFVYASWNTCPLEHEDHRHFFFFFESVTVSVCMLLSSSNWSQYPETTISISLSKSIIIEFLLWLVVFSVRILCNISDYIWRRHVTTFTLFFWFERCECSLCFVSLID